MHRVHRPLCVWLGLVVFVSAAGPVSAYDVEANSTGNSIYVLLRNLHPTAVFSAVSLRRQLPAFVPQASASIVPAEVPASGSALAALGFDVAAAAPAAQGVVGVGVPAPDVGGPDADGDGVSDAHEIAFGSDPLDPSSLPGDADETILVIEDQLALRQLLDRSLTQKGYRVLLAEDGIDAIERSGTGEQPVDLVINDVVMPRLGGAATVARLRSTLGDFRVIFMSGYLGYTHESPHDLDQESAFIEKPFRLHELHAQIQAALAPRAHASS